MGAITDSLGYPAPRLKLPEVSERLAGNVFGGIPGFPFTESKIIASVNRSTYPISRIQQELAYAYVIFIEEGLGQLVEMYKQRQATNGV